MSFSKRKTVVCTITFLICFSLLVTQTFALSLEEVVSRRDSMRSYNTTVTPREQLLDVLRIAYGYTGSHRNTPQIGPDYGLVIYAVNSTGSYRYIPETNSLVVHNLSVTKTTISPHHQSGISDASEILVLVYNSTAVSNNYFPSAEAGCLAQNVYLAAASLDLGTCIIGTINSEGLRNDLGLASTLKPLYVMPLGDPVYSYQSATPKYSIMTGNLPQVQLSTLTFEESVGNITYTQEWSNEPLSLQMLSQLLWAAYGYSSRDSRTTPSSRGIYPLVIYVSNATGIYQYLPESHSVTEIVSGDERYDLANALSGQTWAADAPAMFIIGCNMSYNGGSIGDGGVLDHQALQTDSGCVVQQIFLEAAAWDLEAGIVSDASEVWNGTDAQAVRSIMGLPGSLIPLYAISVGSSALEEYELTVSVTGSGSTVPTVGSHMYENGTEVNVTAYASSGWTLDHWVLDSEDVGGDSYYIVTMDENHSITAVFVQIPPPEYELNISTSGSGSTVPTAGTHMYSEDSEVNVTAYAASGWTLDHWLLDSEDVGNANPYTVTMNENHSITAVFVEIPPTEYELTVSVTGSGSTAPTAGSHMYDEGTEVKVNASAVSGWMLDYWVLDSENVGNASTYIVTMDENHSITAVFAEIPPLEVDSCNSTGATTEVFDVDEEIWVKGSGFEASSLVDVYVVEDVTAWTDGLDISSLTIMNTNTDLPTNANGEILPTPVWTQSLQLGEYDIIVDANKNGIYDEGIDDLDDMDVQTTAGFTIIPEAPLAAVITLVAMAISLLTHNATQKRKHFNN